MCKAKEVWNKLPETRQEQIVEEITRILQEVMNEQIRADYRCPPEA